MNLHPLRAAYLQEIRRRYKQSLGGDKNPVLTECQAMKISRLGLSYSAYMDVAVRLCESTAKFMGWAYPYYNMVIGDKTIAKVHGMLKYTTSVVDNVSNDDDVFERELIYATQYIDWWFGKGERPRRGEHDVPVRIRSAVAEYLCKAHGVPFISSNYNTICKTLEEKEDG